ncbi:permease [Leptolyngbya valderiana BDU 20041]|uniref:permease n=1 Tax=Baaleninema simplex TaxID=2862350 RepID=UPI000344E668|nr:permease [Baaleninema simplex]OAB58883.1 permease [Leptolyngbya valderiana BDU 20041]
MAQLNPAVTVFLSLLVEALPFLLLGVLLSSALLLFVNERKLVAVMPQNPLLGAIVGSSIGFLFPVCECGNVPVARRLLAQGVPPAVAIAFLLAAPTINPIVIWSTWVAFRDQPEIVVWRVLLSLAVATIVGVVFSVQKDLRPLLHPVLARSIPSKALPPSGKDDRDRPALLRKGTYLLGGGELGRDRPIALDEAALLAANPNSGLLVGRPAASRWVLFLDNTVRELRELGGVLVVGSAIVAVVQTAVPRDVIVSLGQGTVTPILAMMLLALVVSICSTVDAFFALSFASTFTSSALLAFLVFGPVIDLKSIGLMLSVFRPRAVFYLFALAAQLTFFFTLALALYVS